MLFKKHLRLKSFVILILISFSFAFPVKAENNEKTLVSDFNRYYYNQLNSIEKTIYENLISSQENFAKGKKVSFIITKYSPNLGLDKYIYYAKKARNAYIYDNPKEYIFFDNYKFLLSSSEDYIYLICNPKESASILVNIKTFETICINFVSTLSGTDEEKLEQIHSFLIQNATYDDSLSLPQTKTAYGTLVNHYSICSGFAFSFKYLADLAGLDVLYVVGNVYDKSTDSFLPHAWNVVFTRGKYYIVDVTFDLNLDHTFFLSSLEDELHFADTNFFNYSF